MPKFYLRLEGVNLNNFVYETADLSTIRGGGLLLLKAVEDVYAKFTQLTPISTGASVGLFSLDADDKQANNLCKDVRDFLQTHGAYKHATFVVDVLKASSNFMEDRERLLAMNRWQQMNSLQVTVPTHNENNVVEVCNLDRVRPALLTAETIKGEPKVVSESVLVRRNHGLRNKRTFVNDELSKVALTNRGDVVHEFAQHFETIAKDKDGSKGNLANKIAVIYLDGNDFTKLQKNLDDTTSPTLSDFDANIKTYRRQWLNSLLSELNNDADWKITDDDDNRSPKTFYRMEILLWGGDEVCLVVPAWKGWEVVQKFFEVSANWDWEGGKLTHAVGIVFCNRKAPIRRMKQLAYDLVDEAKKKPKTENHFAYEILESFDNTGLNLEEHRKKRLPDFYDGDTEALVLLGDGMESAGNVLRQAKEFIPRRKLVELVKLLLRRKPEDATRIISLENEIKSQVPDKDALANHFGGEPICWIHINELWDYVGE